MQNGYFNLRAGLVAGGLLAAGLAQGQTLGISALGAQSLPGTYSDLSTTGAAIATPDFDDSNSAPQNIGFSFTFGGTAFTQFVLNTNGYVKLGTTAPAMPYFSANALTVAGGPLKGSDPFILVPFNTDLEAAASGGTEYRVATTGAAGSRVCTIQWKNVSDKTRAAVSYNIDKQLASISFQLKLYEGSNRVEFVYGPAVASSAPLATGYAQIGSFAQVGLKGAGSGLAQVLSVTKSADTQWSVPTFQAGTYPDYSLSFLFRNVPTTGGPATSTLPDAGRTYRFDPAVANDLAVSTLYSIAQLPAGQAFAYRAYITNPGSNAVSGQTATLTLTGANPQTATAAVPTLAAGASATVSFPSLPLALAGTTTATVTLPADGNPNNNTQAGTTVTVSGGGFSYVSGAVSSGAVAFPSVGSSTSVFAVKYTASTAYTVSVVRARIGGSGDNVGATVYGVVANAAGQVLGQSAPYQLQASDLNQLHTFTLATPVQLPAGDFLAGLAQVVVGGLYPQPLAIQPEVPTRPGTYYTFGLSTPSTPADITATNTYNYRYLIEAGNTTPLATAAPALAGTLSVYPNPSADGRFTLELRDPGTGAVPLTVDVCDVLGRCVYTSTTKSNLATTLDLSGLASNVYYLRVRSGAAVATRQLVMTR